MQVDPGKQRLPASRIFHWYWHSKVTLSIVLFAIIKSKFSNGAELNTASQEAKPWEKLYFLYLSETTTDKTVKNGS